MRLAAILDHASSTPLHRQIYEQWRRGILTGRFRRGDPVPSTRELALTLEVSRSTVTEAYAQLLAEGYLETSHGSGTFVCRNLPDDLLKVRGVARAGPSEAATVRLSRYGAGLTADYRRPHAPPGVIDFAPGTPDLPHFPFPLWRRLLMRHLRKPSHAIFDYAEHSAGYARLCSEIAAYVSRLRAVHCTPEQVIVVNGSQQALDLCARLLLEAGDDVAMENPGYRGAHRVFTAHGTRLHPLAIDGEGVVVRHCNEPARLIYVTPSHQLPMGVSMTLARRLEVIAWARQRGAVIIEDDYCSEYRYSGPPLPSLQGLASGVAVIYIGTFSKIMFPGLRLGYIIAPPQLVPAFARAKWLADRHSPVLEQAALADFLSEGHLERHIRRMRRLYSLRREVLVESLERQFGESVQLFGEAAGMHVMVRFDDARIGQHAAGNRVQLTSANEYYVTEPPGNEFVLGFTAIGERTIREGVKRLAL
ncbi:MAG TPA: PLP-dependent aminotransferase family protein [Bryobacteraceae bacterium]|jgi:GntR family transcriptional regulator/MocR family aminotransferase|nr:PLP-dependent aminotransferase family protein [Bryobacteraceae bacterium]